MPPIARNKRYSYWLLAAFVVGIFAPVIGLTYSGPHIVTLTHLFHAPLPIVATIFAISALTWTGLYTASMLREFRPAFQTKQTRTQPTSSRSKTFATLWAAAYALISNTLVTFFGGAALLSLLLGIHDMPMGVAIAFALFMATVGFLAAYSLARPKIQRLTQRITSRRWAGLRELSPWKTAVATVVAICYTIINSVAASHALGDLGLLMHNEALMHAPVWISVVLGAAAATVSLYALMALFLEYLHHPKQAPTPTHKATLGSWLQTGVQKTLAAITTLSSTVMLFYMMGVDSHSILVIALGAHMAIFPAALIASCACLTLWSLADAGMHQITHMFSPEQAVLLGLAEPTQASEDTPTTKPSLPPTPGKPS